MEKGQWAEWARNLDGKIKAWLGKEAEIKPDGSYFCKKCGGLLIVRKIYCSVHDGYSLFKTCCGSGSVFTIEIPRCSNENCSNYFPNFGDPHIQVNNDTMIGPCIDC